MDINYNKYNNVKTKKSRFKIFIIKYKWKILLILFIMSIIIFPHFYGAILGKWLHLFFKNLFINL
jgi:hypothetical protein